MIGFYCATPYHVLVAVNILQSRKEKGDLYLLNHFKDAKDLVDRIKLTQVFRKVIFLDINNNSIRNKLKRIRNIVYPSSEVYELVTNFDYKDFIFFAYDFFNITFIIKKITQRSVPCKFSYGEDGIGSYMERIYVPNKKVDIILKIIGRKQYLQYIKSIFIFSPEYMITNKEFRTIKIEHVIDQNDKLKSIIGRFWNASNSIEFGNILLFQEPIYEDFTVHNDIEQKVLDYCEKTINGKVTIKGHPRSKIRDENVVCSNIPFECIMHNINFEKTLFISVFSTAALSPCIFYKRFPCIIFLYKIIFKDKMDTKFRDLEAYVEKICEMNNFIKKVFVPETLDEVYQAIEECKVIMDLEDNYDS